ncbi:MAG: serine acetyltransferase [Verrucomicrobiota bacterium]
MIKHLRSDLASHEGDWTRQGFWVMIVYRFGQWRYGISIGLMRKAASLIYKILYKFIQIVAGVELPAEAPIGPRLRIDHFGGIIVSGYARLGSDCVLRQGVTIGLRHPSDPCAPQIGDRVDIGAGAKLLGSIRIGNDVTIGANAVVISDIPDGATAVGIPARVLQAKTSSTKQEKPPQTLAVNGH